MVIVLSFSSRLSVCEREVVAPAASARHMRPAIEVRQLNSASNSARRCAARAADTRRGASRAWAAAPARCPRQPAAARRVFYHDYAVATASVARSLILLGTCRDVTADTSPVLHLCSLRAEPEQEELGVDAATVRPHARVGSLHVSVWRRAPRGVNAPRRRQHNPLGLRPQA